MFCEQGHGSWMLVPLVQRVDCGPNLEPKCVD